jgi:hypothetical protein
LAFFLSLAGFSLFFFSGMHPQPQSFFFSAIIITSFLVKRLSNHLIICAKKNGLLFGGFQLFYPLPYCLKFDIKLFLIFY